MWRRGRCMVLILLIGNSFAAPAVPVTGYFRTGTIMTAKNTNL
jgi:hypothetical protein